jgi:4-carboxymuconolactone decarboxylase
MHPSNTERGRPARVFLHDCDFGEGRFRSSGSALRHPRDATRPFRQICNPANWFGTPPRLPDMRNTMDKARFDKGLEVRTAVLGKDYVETSMKNADDFNRPFQEFVTEYCWGAAWGSDGLSHKTRSMLNIAMISILNRPHELKLHVKGALRNGVTKDEIREVLLQVAVYAGVPCGVDAFRIAREAFKEYEAA